MLRPTEMRAVIAPGADDELRLASGAQDGAVVAAPDRIAHPSHFLRIGRAPAEEVGDDQRAVAPALGIEPRARARGIELPLVGGARIEHEEVGYGQRRVPAPPQQIAPAAARR